MDALDSLLKNITNAEETLSIAKLYALSGLDRDELERVRRVWPSTAVDRRQAIMHHLVEITEANFEVDFGSIFRMGLADEDPEVRTAAIDGLWEEEDVKLIPALLDLLRHDSSETVRAAAATSLGHFVLAGELEEIPAAKLEQVVESLRDVFEDDSEALDVRRRAVEAIGYSSADGVADLIAEAYADDEEPMRISAVFAMGRSADLRWAGQALAEVDSPDPEMRYEAVRACGELQNPDAIPALTTLLDDPDYQVREATVWALGQIGGHEARRLLAGILEDEESDLREVAEAALDELEFMSGSDLDFPMLHFDAGDDGTDRDA
jgi:HEAT repeat protein